MVFGSLKRLTKHVEQTEFRCPVCSSRFERERLNCPACGSQEIEEVPVGSTGR